MTLPLHGVRVVEYAQYVAGPLCGVLLADLGADVIKIEPPTGDAYRYVMPVAPGVGRYFIPLNRGKRSVAIDLKTGDGRRSSERLLASADVVVHNFPPERAHRFGLDWDTVHAAHSGIVVGFVSSYGSTGPLAGTPAYDLVAQARAGLLTAHAAPGDRLPVRARGIPMGAPTGGLLPATGVPAPPVRAAATGVREPWQGFLVAAISGIGVGGFWPSQSTLIAGHTTPEQRPAAFAMQRVVMNLGIGLGALTGGLIAATDSPTSFTVLFLLDAATFLVYGGVMLAFVPDPAIASGAHASGRSGSYRDVLRHRAFVAVIGLNALFIFAGFSGFDVLPVYAKNEAGLTETQIGLLFFVNTLVIVIAQLPLARIARGRRRMPTLALLGALWAGAWAIVPLAGSASPRGAVWLLVVAMTVFAVGECLHGTVQAPLVADLAEPRLLGRYMALSALSWQLGFALGPAIGGIGLELSPNGVWLGAAGLCAVGGVVALAIESTIPARARRTPAPVAASA